MSTFSSSVSPILIKGGDPSQRSDINIQEPIDVDRFEKNRVFTTQQATKTEQSSGGGGGNSQLEKTLPFLAIIAAGAILIFNS